MMKIYVEKIVFIIAGLVILFSLFCKIGPPILKYDGFDPLSNI